MASITAPFVETQQVVTGFMYQLQIGEEANGLGITRLDIGPYYFPGAAPQIRYPEAVTNEMTPPGWAAIRWYTDEAGASWLRWDGGRIVTEDGEMLFQMTSNYPPSQSGAALYVFRGKQGPERYAIAAPDYSQPPPAVNPRHDVKGPASVRTGNRLRPAAGAGRACRRGCADAARDLAPGTVMRNRHFQCRYTKIMTTLIDQIRWDKADGGLVPAIVQDAETKDVLMLGFMNRDALEKTLRSGLVTFWTRSRQTLWTKGETSGNTLNFVSLRVNCNDDSLLVLARPIGATCHTGHPTCYFREVLSEDEDWQTITVPQFDPEQVYAKESA